MIGRAGMGAKIGTAWLDVRGDFSSLDKQVGQQTRTLKSRFASMGKAAGLALGAGVVIETKRAVAAWREAEKVAGQTTAVLKSTGGQANVTAKQISGLADAISLKAGIDDEAIQSSENLLLTFTRVRNETGKGNAIFNQATQSIVDMSVAMDQDLKSSTIQVGKALNDPIKGLTALQRVGVSFTESQKEMVKGWVESGQTLRAQKFILAELKTEFGGSAAAQADAFDKAKVAIENLEEALGGAVGPALARAAGGLATFVNQVRTGTGAGGEFRATVEGVARTVAGVAAAVGPAVSAIGGLALGVAKLGLAFLQTKAGIVVLSAALGALAGRMAGVAAAFVVTKIAAFGAAIGSLRTLALVAGTALIQLRTGLIGVSAASAATGVGALLTVVGLVAGAILGMKANTDKATLSQRDFRDAILGTRNALDQYADAANTTRDANLAHRGAVLNLRRAEENLQDVRRSGTSTALEVKQAEHEVALAKREVGRTTTESTRAQRDESAVRRKAIADAREQLEKIRGNTNALRDEVNQLKTWINVGEDSIHIQKEFGEGAEGVRKAREKLREKTRELAASEKAQQSEQERLTTAMRTGGQETSTYAERVERLNRQIRQLKSKKITVTASVKLAAAGVAAGAAEVAAGLSGGPTADDYVGGVTSQSVRTGKFDLSGLIKALVPGSGSAQLGRFKSISAAMGLSAGTGPGQGFRLGDKGWHGEGRAFDSSGPAGQMMKFARTMFSAFGSGLKELIYSPMGIGIKNGQPVNIKSFYGDKQYRDHFDHVHVAAQRGGMIPGVGDGDKVPVLAEPGEGFINKRAVRALGGRGAIDAINRMLPRFQKGGVAGVAADAARKAGFKGSLLRLMVAIAGAESGGYNTRAHNTVGEDSRGLWQINVGPGANTDLRGLNLFNPFVNAKAAKTVYDRQGLRAWTMYTNQGYRSWMDEATAAIAGGGAGPLRARWQRGLTDRGGWAKGHRRGKAKMKPGVRGIQAAPGSNYDPIFKGSVAASEVPSTDPETSALTETMSAASTESAELLRALLDASRKRLQVSQAQYGVLRDMPPYGGRFHGGGVVPGPAGQERTIIAKAGETVGAGSFQVIVNGDIVNTPRGKEPIEIRDEVRQAVRAEVRYVGRTAGRAGVLR